MPAEGIDLTPREQLLSAPEISRLVRASPTQCLHAIRRCLWHGVLQRSLPAFSELHSPDACVSDGELRLRSLVQLSLVKSNRWVCITCSTRRGGGDGYCVQVSGPFDFAELRHGA